MFPGLGTPRRVRKHVKVRPSFVRTFISPRYSTHLSHLDSMQYRQRLDRKSSCPSTIARPASKMLGIGETNTKRPPTPKGIHDAVGSDGAGTDVASVSATAPEVSVHFAWGMGGSQVGLLQVEPVALFASGCYLACCEECKNVFPAAFSSNGRANRPDRSLEERFRRFFDEPGRHWESVALARGKTQREA